MERYYTIQCSGVYYLLCSFYCKQKVDESQQSGSSQLIEIEQHIVCKCAFSGECDRNNHSFATHNTVNIWKITAHAISCTRSIPLRMLLLLIVVFFFYKSHLACTHGAYDLILSISFCIFIVVYISFLQFVHMVKLDLLVAVLLMRVE